LIILLSYTTILRSDDIQTMVNQVDDDALCFYDIGSAEMNTDLAIEMYEGEHRLEKIDAPIVEGTFTAAVKVPSTIGASIFSKRCSPSYISIAKSVFISAEPMS